MFTLSSDNAIEYARSRGLLANGDEAWIEALPGGVSCTTLRLHLEMGRVAIVIKQALPKLRVEADWFSDPRRSRHEVLAIQFARLEVRICEEIIGGQIQFPFILVQTVDGCLLPCLR